LSNKNKLFNILDREFKLPTEIQKNYTDMVRELKEKVEKNKAWVEDKKVSLTYHYRDILYWLGIRN